MAARSWICARRSRAPYRCRRAITTPQSTPEFSCYIRELHWAQRLALENRAEMIDRFRAVLARWMGSDADTAEDIEVERMTAGNRSNHMCVIHPHCG